MTTNDLMIICIQVVCPRVVQNNACKATEKEALNANRTLIPLTNTCTTD